MTFNSPLTALISWKDFFIGQLPLYAASFLLLCCVCVVYGRGIARFFSAWRVWWPTALPVNVTARPPKTSSTSGRNLSGETTTTKVKQGIKHAAQAGTTLILVIASAGIAYDFGLRAGYHEGTEDAKSHTLFHARPKVHWKIVREYASKTYTGHPAFDVEQPGGEVTKNMTPCEYRGIHPGALITSVGFTDRGDCLSFAEPGWMKIEYPDEAEK